MIASDDLRQQLAQCIIERDMHQALKRLENNADFALVITQGFLRNQCLSWLNASVNGALHEAHRADALACAQSGGYLAQ